MTIGKYEVQHFSIIIGLLLLFTIVFPTEISTAVSSTDHLYDDFNFSDYSVKKVDSSGVSSKIYDSSSERKTTCQRMNGMANVSWKVNKSFNYTYKKNETTNIRANVTYYGLPYTQVNRDYSNAKQSVVQNRMTTAANSGGSGVYGVDCSAAVSYAIRTGKGKTDSDTYLMGASSAYLATAFLYDGTRIGSGTGEIISGSNVTNFTYRDCLHHVGWFGNYTGYSTQKTTVAILENLRNAYPAGAGDIYSNVYAKVRPGDVMVRIRKDGGGHVVMVTAVVIVYNADGTINPARSYFYITDQNSPKIRDYDNTSSWESSWRRNYHGNTTFEKMRGYGYLPVSAFDGSLSYTVNYDANGGDVVPSAQTKKIYKSIKLSTVAPKKTGYTFNGWKPTKDPIDKTYLPGAYYNEDINETLRATWSINKATIQYNANGGQGAPSNQIKSYGENIPLSSVSPTRDGYTFLGWAEGDRTASIPGYKPGDLFSDDSKLLSQSGALITMYAVWQKDSVPTNNPGNDNVNDDVNSGNNVKDNIGTPQAKSKVTVRSTSITKLKKGKKKMTVTWRKVAGVAGYQIQYSQSSRFASGNKAVNVAASKKAKLTVKKLTKKKVYYARIRTYKTVGGKTCYSGWSAAKSVKVK